MPSTRDPIHWIVSVTSLGIFEIPPECLHHGGNFRIRKGDSLRIRVPSGAFIHQENLRLCITDSLGNTSKYDGVYYLLGDIYFDWTADSVSVGPCLFFFEYSSFDNQSTSDALPQINESVVNTVLIESNIIINGNVFPVTALSIQTIPAFLLGPLDTWLQKLNVTTAYQEFTMIHFTPVQKPGESGSCYSIEGHHEIAECLVPRHLRKSPSADVWAYLKNIIKQLETDYGIITTSDLVLNHVAASSPWLKEHPDVGYNVYNSPHLRAPIELDILLHQFALRFSRNEYQDQGVSNEIHNESDLKMLMNLLKKEVLIPFNIKEWFQLPMEDLLSSAPCFNDINAGSYVNSDDNVQLLTYLVHIVYRECLRMVGVKRKIGIHFEWNILENEKLDRAFTRVLLEKVQEKLYAECNRVYSTILNALEGFIRWQWLEKQEDSNTYKTLIPNYFTAVQKDNGEVIHLANNGWVMDWDSHKDFMDPEHLVHLSRSLHVWSDCVKLYYGKQSNDAAFIWSYMKRYCYTTASTFFGIRLDNCHSTPPHVAKYMLNACREANPDLWVFAELFSGNMDFDSMLERQLGINAFLRESLQASSPRNLGTLQDAYLLMSAPYTEIDTLKRVADYIP